MQTCIGGVSRILAFRMCDLPCRGFAAARTNRQTEPPGKPSLPGLGNLAPLAINKGWG